MTFPHFSIPQIIPHSASFFPHSTFRKIPVVDIPQSAFRKVFLPWDRSSSAWEREIWPECVSLTTNAWELTGLQLWCHCGNMWNDNGHVDWRFDQSLRIFDTAFYFPHFTHYLVQRYRVVTCRKSQLCAATTESCYNLAADVIWKHSFKRIHAEKSFNISVMKIQNKACTGSWVKVK